ncbi:MAG: hypothetical protein ACT4NV_18365 [Rhodoferax sp.]
MALNGLFIAKTSYAQFNPLAMIQLRRMGYSICGPNVNDFRAIWVGAAAAP